MKYRNNQYFILDMFPPVKCFSCGKTFFTKIKKNGEYEVCINGNIKECCSLHIRCICNPSDQVLKYKSPYEIEEQVPRVIQLR